MVDIYTRLCDLSEDLGGDPRFTEDLLLPSCSVSDCDVIDELAELLRTSNMVNILTDLTRHGAIDGGKTQSLLSALKKKEDQRRRNLPDADFSCVSEVIRASEQENADINIKMSGGSDGKYVGLLATLTDNADEFGTCKIYIEC